MQVTMNGRAYAVEPDQTILQAARANGVYIPSLCYHEKVGASGKCRACLVEVQGRPGLHTACTTPVQDGMVITTNSPQVMETQRFVVDLILSSGNHDCLACEKNGDCELQNAAYYLGIERPSMKDAEIPQDTDDSAAFVTVDRTKCILCGRCIEACQHVVVNQVLGFQERGRHTRVGFDINAPMGDSSCVQCGECAQICPVGAITNKKSIRQGRPWEMRTVRTTCPYCGVGCQLDLHVKGEQITKVTGSEQAAPNQGRLCVKGRYGYDFIYAADRLTTPLIKKDGVFHEASWDEALDLVANKIKSVIATDGPDAIAGVSCARSINEDSYQMQKLFRAVFKTNNLDHCART